MHVTLTEPEWGRDCSPYLDGALLECCMEACEEGGWALCAYRPAGVAVYTPEGRPVLVLRRGVVTLELDDLSPWVDLAEIAAYRQTPHAPCPVPMRGDAVIVPEEAL
jgi:hypothetical protein